MIAEVLAVGGGGGGGKSSEGGFGAGGGGAGGLLYYESYLMSVKSYPITIGNGGSGASVDNDSGYPGGSTIVSNSGGTTIYAYGGGGGRRNTNDDRTGGGSGGGGFNQYAGGNSFDSSQGYRGGGPHPNSDGGSGGGGRNGGGGNGPSAGVAGAGGSGWTSFISGSSVIYAAGGGGSARITGGAGGSGIGGAGSVIGAGGNGATNTGSGGGGGRGGNGGNGGSGIVIIRYLTPESNPAPTGSPSYSYPDGYLNTSYQSITKASLLTGFSDPGDTMGISGLTANNGTLVNNGNDTWTFIPNTNFSGTVTLNYNVTDTGGNSVATTDTFNILNQDPYTKLLLHMDGTNGSTTFTDSSGTGKTVTPSGNAVISTVNKYLGTASGLFDGYGDYLTTPDSDDWAFGSTNFTIDFWINFTNSDPLNQYMFWQSNGNSNQTITYNFVNKRLYFRNVDNNSNARVMFYTTNWDAGFNQWYHVAITRNNNSYNVFVNGESQSITLQSGSYSNELYDISATTYIGAQTISINNSSINGYLDELRISKGIARWTTNFTPPTSAYSMPNNAPALTGSKANLPTALMNTTTYNIYRTDPTYGLTKGFTDVDGDTLDISDISVDHGSLTINGLNWYYNAETNYTGPVTISYNVTDGNGGSTPATQTFYVESQDPYTKLLLHMDGPNNSTQFLDSSFTNKTVTANGLAIHSTSEKKYGSASGYFSNNNAGLSIPDSDDWDMTNGNFTVDFWVNFDSLVNVTHRWLMIQYLDSNNYWGIYRSSTGKLTLYGYSNSSQKFNFNADISSVTALSWNHLTIERSGADCLMFLNGQQLSVTVSKTWTGTMGNIASPLNIVGTGRYFTGYLDEFRITKGLARWTSNFTPPGGAYQQSNSSPTLSGSQATLSNGTEDTAYIVSKASLLTGFTDPDGDTLNISVPTSNHGSVVDNGNNTYTLTPTSNYNGLVTFSYNVTDGRGGSLAATLGMTLSAVNDAPTLTGTPNTISSIQKDTATTILKSDLLSGYTDADNDTLTLVNIVTNNGNISSNGSNYTFTPTAGYTGSANITYDISDGQGGTVPGVIKDFQIINVISTGGNITLNGSYIIHTFTSSGVFNPGRNITAEVMVIAGGGGGGQCYGGGGGAGGYISNSSFSISNQSYNVTVGSGGIGSNFSGFAGSNGQNTVFSSLTANGGGGGGSQWSNASNGGSGGGAGKNGDLSKSGGSGTVGQGNNGQSVGQYNLNGGGGGGAGWTNNSIYGDGGYGVDNAISGISQCYAGGGKGGGYSSGGFVYNCGGGIGGISGAGSNGIANTGGGGGGAGSCGSDKGGDGGSGIVIIKYLAPNNQSPVLSSPQSSLSSGPEDTSYTILKSDLLTGFTDPDSDPLDIANLSANHGTLGSYDPNIGGSGIGGWSFTPSLNYHGQVDLSYDVIDGNDGTLPATHHFNLSNVNDNPISSSSHATLSDIQRNTSLLLTKEELLQGYTDPDSTDILDIDNLLSSEGTFTPNGLNYTFTLHHNYSGPVTINYDVIDGNGGTLAATLTLSSYNFSEAQIDFLTTTAGLTENQVNNDLNNVYIFHQSGRHIGNYYWTFRSGPLPGQSSFSIGDTWTYDGKYYLYLGSGLEGQDDEPPPPAPTDGDYSGQFDVKGTITDESSIDCTPSVSLGSVSGLSDGSMETIGDGIVCGIMTSNSNGWELQLESSNSDYDGKLMLNGSTGGGSHREFQRYVPVSGLGNPDPDWIDASDNAIFGFRINSGSKAASTYYYNSGTSTCGSGSLTADHCWDGIPDFGNPKSIAGDNTASPDLTETGIQFKAQKMNYWLQQSAANEDYYIEILATLYNSF